MRPNNLRLQTFLFLSTCALLLPQSLSSFQTDRSSSKPNTAPPDRRSTAYVRNAILAPAERLPEGFLFVRAITASGKSIEGIRLNEDTFSVQIKDATGNFHSFRKQDLKELQKLRGQTPMPSYKTILSPAELEDLIAYLFSTRAAQ